MAIRSLLLRDRDRIHHLVEQRRTFNEQEFQVATEVVGKASCYPDRKDDCLFFAIHGPDFFTEYLRFGPTAKIKASHDLYRIVVDELYSTKGVG